MSANARTQLKKKIVCGQASWRVDSSHVEAFVTEMGGHLAPVTFAWTGRKLQPHPVHGETANARWQFRSLQAMGGRTCLHLSLNTNARRGRVDKRIWLLDGQN